MRKQCFYLAVILLAGCTLQMPTADPQMKSPLTGTMQDTAAGPLSQTAVASETLVSPSATLQPTSLPTIKIATDPFLDICSPMEDVALDDLIEKITNPYFPPRAGSDDPHQGTDFAELQPGTEIALAGLTVHAVLEGEVAGLINDRFPYGNAILIETPLDRLDLAEEFFPTAIPTFDIIPALTCPSYLGEVTWSEQNRSLYQLYAHLESLPNLAPGDHVRCGQILGAIGDSGNALNPHLHLEMRVGPGGARFQSMSHYDSSATIEEMALYCIWRVSGMFQTIDPLKVLVQP